MTQDMKILKIVGEFFKNLVRNIWVRSWFSLEAFKFKFKFIYCRFVLHVSCAK